MSEVKEILQSLMQDGLLLPQTVVDYATPEDSPLHKYFNWDDSQAAKAWRIHQARMLICSVTITHGDVHKQEIRAFVSLATDRLHGSGYRTIESVLSNDFMRQQLATEMMNLSYLWADRARQLGVKISTQEVRKLAKKVKAKG